MQDFKKLEVWKQSFLLNKKIYALTSTFPKEEIYGLTNQIRRSSVSISSNIAEGCGRRTNKDFIKFLYTSMGSLKELENQLMLAEELGYLKIKELFLINNELQEIGKQLTKFIQCLY